MGKTKTLILVAIIVMAALLRLWHLGTVPPGLHADEASQGFNAYSLLKTGKDMYGKRFPILFRASGSYQPPIYTYLSIIPVALLGNSVFSIRFLSAVAGICLVILTFFFVRKYVDKRAALITAAALAISPWAIHFSRLAVEANLAVSIFVLGVFVLLISLRKINLFPIAALILGLATHAYYSERVVVTLLLVVTLIVWQKIFIKNWKTTLGGLFVFALVMLPHLYILTTGALTKRLDQVSYLFGGGNLVGEFFNHYLSYFSPRNLFLSPVTNMGLVTTDIGVFYPWFIVPLLFGVRQLLKKRNSDLVKMITILIVVTPVPAGLTGDIFYPLRILDFLWVLTVIIGFGSVEILNLIKNRIIKMTIIGGLLLASLAAFGLTYFVLLKYEAAPATGEVYIRLLPKLLESNYQNIYVDVSGRNWGVGIRTTYLAAEDPVKVQQNLSSQLTTSYYSGVVESKETFKVRNIIFEPLNWDHFCGPNRLFVGDAFSLDPKTIDQHRLKIVFNISDYLNRPVLFAYTTSMSCQ